MMCKEGAGSSLHSELGEFLKVVIVLVICDPLCSDSHVSVSRGSF